MSIIDDFSYINRRIDEIHGKTPKKSAEPDDPNVDSVCQNPSSGPISGSINAIATSYPIMRAIHPNTYAPGYLMYGVFVADELIRDLKCIIGRTLQEMVYDVLIDQGATILFAAFLSDWWNYESRYGTI